MWPQNALTERLNLKWPILQAPMGELTTPSLASAVSNTGGLGGLGMWGFSGEEAERRVAGFRQMSGGSLNVNYPLWEDAGDLTGQCAPMQSTLERIYEREDLGPMPSPESSPGTVNEEHLAMLQKMKPEVVSFHFGLPDQDILEEIKKIGIFVVCSATTAAEALELETRGVDAVIAQGTEAGGHRGTFSGVDISMQPGLFSLLPQIVDAIAVPVIAAGGIADGRGVAAALMLGASGVQIGTAFLRCEEADVLHTHRAALASADDTSTIVTNLISGRPARFVKNQLIQELTDCGAEPLPFPAQLSLTYPLEASGKQELSGMYAGQSARLTRAMPAAELVETLAEETSARLAHFNNGS
ncbi:MAG: NAD(P)H-dependent flavin oxidoreductase [Hyphomicrobiales bacterium]